MKTRGMIGALTVALALAGCGVSGGSNGSCTRTDNRCVELGAGHYPGEYPAGCVSPSTYSSGPCATTGRVGHCLQTTTVSGSSSQLTMYYYAPLTVTEAMNDCSAFGTSIGSSGSAVFTAD